METTLGDLVGYAIRFESVASQNTKIKYLTDGILLREIISDPMLLTYSVIIIDEAHEWSLHSDILFNLLKQIVKSWSDLKLIVTSATMNIEKFQEYFEFAPVVMVQGRSFPVEIQYDSTFIDDFLIAVVKKAIQIHIKE